MAYQILPPFKLIDGASMATDITSDPQEIILQDNIGIQLHWTGAPVGTFDIQISGNHKEDQNGNVLVAGDWVTLALSPAIVAAGSADDAYIDLNQMSAMYMRVVFNRTSGTGTLDAYVVGKAI